MIPQPCGSSEREIRLVQLTITLAGNGAGDGCSQGCIGLELQERAPERELGGALEARK